LLELPAVQTGISLRKLEDDRAAALADHEIGEIKSDQIVQMKTAKPENEESPELPNKQLKFLRKTGSTKIKGKREFMSLDSLSILVPLLVNPMQSVSELKPCTAVSSQDRSFRNVEKFRRFPLRGSRIPKKLKDFSFIVGQPVHLLMELSPSSEGFRRVGVACVVVSGT
jgi:hypothetical protein